MGCGASRSTDPSLPDPGAVQLAKAPPAQTQPAKATEESNAPPIEFPTGTPADTQEAIRTEIARVRQLPPAELAKLGTKYTDPEALWEALGALNGKATLILRATWVKTQRGGRLPKRGDKLPPEALATVVDQSDGSAEPRVGRYSAARSCALDEPACTVGCDCGPLMTEAVATTEAHVTLARAIGAKVSRSKEFVLGLPHLRTSQWRPFIALLVLAGAMFSLAGLFLPLVLIRPQKVFALPRRRTLHTLRRAAHPHPCTRGASFRSSSRWDPCSSSRPLPSYVGRWSS